MKSILCIVALLAFATAEYPSYGTPAYLNDNNVLQYALTLENLEYSFYTQALARFNSTDFTNAGLGGTVYNFISIIQMHEQSHVQQLSTLLRARGVVPVMPCNYTFTSYYNSVQTFVALATALEETGVRAYDGAISLLTQTDLVSLAGSVATVEARHAAYLNALNASNPFPSPTDLTNTVAQIFGQAGVFFNGACTYLTNVTSATYTIADSFRNVTAYNGSAANLNDYNVLQFALTLETLEAHFYNTALTNIQPATFSGAGFPAAIQALFAVIQGHENYHVQFLRTFLSNAGQTPVGNCTTYKFDANLTNDAAGITFFLSTGVQLEAGGVAAYLGALPYLTSEALITLAATITTVEARHASFLSSIASGGTATPSPFPNIVDPSYAPSLVIGSVLPLFAAGCPNVPALILADNFRANSTNVPTSSSSSSTSSSSNSASTTTVSSSGSVTGTVTGTRSTSGSTGSGTVTGTVTGSRSSSGSRTATTTGATAQNSDASVAAVSVAVLAALALVL